MTECVWGSVLHASIPGWLHLGACLAALHLSSLNNIFSTHPYLFMEHSILLKKKSFPIS